jgi:hypothetical protein
MNPRFPCSWPHHLDLIVLYRITRWLALKGDCWFATVLESEEMAEPQLFDFHRLHRMNHVKVLSSLTSLIYA